DHGVATGERRKLRWICTDLTSPEPFRSIEMEKVCKDPTYQPKLAGTFYIRPRRVDETCHTPRLPDECILNAGCKIPEGTCKAVCSGRYTGFNCAAGVPPRAGSSYVCI